MVVQLLQHKRRDGKDWETLVRGQVETDGGVGSAVVRAGSVVCFAFKAN
jgi:hypothetical protein